MPNGQSLERKHMTCVVCGKGFNSEFDWSLNTYPIFHPKTADNTFCSCEAQFFEVLLKLYKFLQENLTSVQLQQLISEIDWGLVIKKREMILWCLSQGYLALDNLNRIIMPPAVNDICKELFASKNLDDPDYKIKALDYLQSAFCVLKDELKPSNYKSPFGEIEEEEKEEKEERKLNRMHTIEMTSSGRLARLATQKK